MSGEVSTRAESDPEWPNARSSKRSSTLLPIRPTVATPEGGPGGAQKTRTEGLTTRSDILLMTKKNPTGGGDAVALGIQPTHRRFLRSVFVMARDGIKGELAKYSDQLKEPTRLRREEAVYDDLLTALERRSISPNPNVDVRHVLEDLAQTIDRANEYDRVISEHAALLGLLKQVGGAEETK